MTAARQPMRIAGFEKTNTTGYYDHHKAQHHAHATILRGLGQKWAKIVYAVWSSGDPYDEARHIEQLKRHEVVWALSL